MADPGRIQQILTNLAENAGKFTVRRRVLINIDCQQHMPEQAQIRITIEHTDIDIAEDPPERLFDKFTQVGAGHPETVSRPHGRYYWNPERTRARVGLLFCAAITPAPTWGSRCSSSRGSLSTPRVGGPGASGHATSTPGTVGELVLKPPRL